MKKQKKDKLRINKLRFAVCVVIIFCLIVFYSNSFFAKFLCMLKKTVYAEPTTIAMFMFFGMIPIYLIYAMNISIVRPEKTKKVFVKTAIVIVLTIIVFSVNLTCFNFIDQNGIQYNKVYYSDSEINNIEVAVEKISNSLDSKYSSFEYLLVCRINTESNKIVFQSDNFYSYEELYNYLVRMNNVLTVDTNGFSDLINYEKSRLIPKSVLESDLNYIKRIEML